MTQKCEGPPAAKATPSDEVQHLDSIELLTVRQADRITRRHTWVKLADTDAMGSLRAKIGGAA